MNHLMASNEWNACLPSSKPIFFFKKTQTKHKTITEEMHPRFCKTGSKLECQSNNGELILILFLLIGYALIF